MQTWFYRVKEHPDGYASEEFKFDMDGDHTEQVYRDSEGKRLENRHVEVFIHTLMFRNE
jgi:hypothetical protein